MEHELVAVVKEPLSEIVGGGTPARDIRFVLIPHTDCLTPQRRLSLWREMEHELVAVVKEPLAVDRFVVSDGEVFFEAGAGAGERLLDRNRLDPVDGVLKPQVRTRRLGDVERRPWICRLAADVQK